MASEVVEIEGHIIDSLTLAKVMDVILAAGADYQILDVEHRQDQRRHEPRPHRDLRTR